MKKWLIAIGVIFSVASSWAAGLEGKWNVKNLNQIAAKEGKMDDMGVLGILGVADEIEFKSNGTFYVNDSVYGKYSMKGDELVMTRDAALVESAKKKFMKELGDQKDSLSVALDEFMKGYAEDSLVISFTKLGNTALVEINQNMDIMKLMPFAPLNMLEKKGAAKEDWNQGVTLSGAYAATVMGMMSIVFDFKPKGVLEQTISFFGMDKKIQGTYSVKNSVLTTKLDGKEESYPFYMGKNCLYMVMEKEGSKVAVPCWKK